ncbi:MAG: FecR family protein [Planctomycetota bacterium]|nr:FecR family protein [Planctomycetota bacterium]
MRRDERKPGGEGNGARDALARLIHAAGPRPSVPAEAAQRVKRAVHAEWRQALARRRRVRRLFWAAPLAAAAALVFWAVQAAFLEPPPRAEGWIARLELSAGTVTLTHGSSTRVLGVGDEVAGGALLETGAGRAALRLKDGPALRLDTGTRLELLSPELVQLSSGAVYVDTQGVSKGKGALEVRTARGSAKHVGTQFEVRLDGAALRIRVREGRVELRRESGTALAEAGEELAIDAAGQLARAKVPFSGEAWDWIQRVAPPFELEGCSLGAYLDWLGRETGWRVRFEDPRAEAAAREVTLHGDVSRLAPDQSVEAVLPACAFTWRLEAGTLVIAPQAHE